MKRNFIKSFLSLTLVFLMLIGNFSVLANTLPTTNPVVEEEKPKEEEKKPEEKPKEEDKKPTEEQPPKEKQEEEKPKEEEQKEPTKEELELIKELTEELVKLRELESKILKTPIVDNTEESVVLTPGKDIEMEEPVKLSEDQYNRLKSYAKSNEKDNNISIDTDKLKKVQDRIKQIEDKLKELSVKYKKNLIPNEENNDGLEISPQLPNQKLQLKAPSSTDNSISIHWIEGNVTTQQEYTSQDWTSTSKDMKVRIDYKLNSDEEIKPGQLEITIPRYLYKDRDGKEIGNITFGVPRFPSSKQPMAYIEKDDVITFVNTQPLPKSTVAFIEATYRSVKPELVKDKITGKKSNIINATLKLQKGETVDTRTSNQNLTTDVDTKATLTGINTNISKPYGYAYELYPDTFPQELRPSDSDKYVYVDYTFNMNNFATQPYNLKFISEALNYDGKVLGIRNSSENKIINGNNTNKFETEINTPNKFGNNRYQNYMRVFVAYPVTSFNEQKTYNLKLKGKYVLTSVDDKEESVKESTLDVDYTPVKFEAPDNHFWIDKNGDGNRTTWNGNKNEGDYNYALNELSLGRDVDLLYNTRVRAFNLPFTYPTWKPGTNDKTSNLSDYKQRKFKIEVKDSKSNTELNYQIKSLLISDLKLYDYVKYTSSGDGYHEEPNGTLSSGFIPIGNYGYKSTQRLSDFSIKEKDYTFEILGSKDGNTFKKYADISIDSGVNISSTNGATTSGDKLIFPEGIKEYKVILTSGIPGYTFTLNPTITLKADSMSKQFADKALLKDIPLERIKTDGNIVGYTDTNQKVPGNEDYSHDKLMGMLTGVRFLGNMSYTNDTENSRVNLKYTLKMQNQTNQTELKDIKEAVELGAFKEETRAKWYVLLPKGLDLNINSVDARNGDSVLDKQIIKNFKNSGRDLLVLDIKQTPNYKMRFKYSTGNFINMDGYSDEPTITFEGKYPWVMMKQNYKELLNGKIDYTVKLDAVYKSENVQLGSLKNYTGEDSSISNNSNKYTPSDLDNILKNIDKVDNNNSYLYTTVNKSLVVDTAASIGVDKLVDVNNEKDYTSGTSYEDKKYVYENGYYSYRIIASNDEKSDTANLVIYDKLDRYNLVSGKDNEYGSKQFKGKFRGLDLSMAESLDINPVIYYSTDENIDIGTDTITSDMNLKSNKWTTRKPNDEDITAVAIDLSKKKNGTDYILKKNQSIMAEILMKAPAIKDIEKDSYAFNKASLTFTNSAGMETSRNIVVTQKTKIGIKPFYITVNAKWDDDDNRDGKRPENIIIKLVQDGKEIGQAVTLDESNKLTYKFDNVEYQDAKGNIHNYTFKKAGTKDDYNYILKSPKKYDDRLEYEIVAKHDPEKISVKGRKIWQGKKTGLLSRYDESSLNRPTSIKVKMYRNGEEYKTITVVPDKDNNWYFESPDEYKYENKGQEIKYEFKEEEYIEGYIPPEYSDDSLTIINNYYPFGNLKITKRLVNATKQAKEQSFKFEFTLETKEGQNSYKTNMDTYKYVTESGKKGEVSTGGVIEIGSINGKPEEVTILDLPTESRVTITEVDQPGFKATRKVQKIEIKSGRESQLDFENTYDTKGEIILKGTKEVQGKKLEPFKFLFDLTDNKGTTIQSVRNGSDGSIYFEPIKYSLKDLDLTTGQGKFEYTIKERDTGLPGYTYDNKLYRVIVNLQDNGDGTITATPKYELLGDKVDKFFFVNNYKAFGDLKITAYKGIKYSTLKPDENTIEYTVYDENDVAITTGKNDSQGKIVLAKSKYYNENHINKSYTYKVRETKYDTNLFEENKEYLKFKDTIKDNGNGTLSVNQEYLGRYNELNKRVDDINNTEPKLENKGKKVDIEVKKFINGDVIDKDKLFKFKVKFTGDKDNIPKKLDIERLNENEIITFPEDPTRPKEELSSLTGGLDLSVSNLINTFNPVSSPQQENGNGEGYDYKISKYGRSLFNNMEINEEYENYIIKYSKNNLNLNILISPRPDDPILVVDYDNRTRLDIELIVEITYREIFFDRLINKHNARIIERLPIHLDINKLSRNHIEQRLHPAQGELDMNIFISGAYIRYEDLNSEYTQSEQSTADNRYDTTLNITNEYADGLDVVYHSNNGETKSFKKKYKPNLLLTTEAFPDNQDNWGNPGLIMKGWSTDPKATQPMYKVNEPIKNTDIYTKRSTEEATLNKVDLYAVWGKPGFTITFNKNTGEGSMADQTIEYDTPTELSKNTFYKSGKRFVGWSTTANGQVELEDKAKITKSESQITNDKLTLYAIWEDKNLSLISDNGEFEFTLKASEVAKLKNIPSYLEYEITELPDPAWGLVSSKNTKGTTIPGDLKTSEFTNEYGAKSTQYSFKGIKKINGTPSSIDDFEFKLIDKTTNKEYLTKANSTDGKFSFEPIVFTRPGTYSFEVSEVAHNNPAYTTDNSKFNVNIVVEEKEGKLVVTSKQPTIEFNNNVRSSTIKVTKKLEGDWLRRDESFDFTLNLNGVESNFSLSENQSKEFDVKYGDKFSVTETSKGDWVVKSSNESGIVDQEIENITFMNRSTMNINNDNDGKTTTLQFKKKLIGRNLLNKEFKFNIDFKDSSDNVIRNIVLSNDSNGDVKEELSSLLFKKASKIEIKEIEGNDDTVIYDTKTYIYNISEENGNVTIKDFEDNSLDNLLIVNKIKPGYLNIKLNVNNETEKVKDNEFTIKVKIDDEVKEYILKNGQSEQIELTVGSSYEIFADNLPEGFKLDSITRSDGTVEINKTSNSEVNLEYIIDAKFTPTAIKKMLDADGNESEELLKQYVFNYVLLNDKEEVIGKAQNDNLGNIIFTDINYGLKDIGKTYKYTLAELEDGQYGIVFDKSQFNIEVTVEDTGKGLQLNYKIIRNLNDESNEVGKVEFTNKYRIPIGMPETGKYSSIINILIILSMISIAYIIQTKRKKSINIK